MITLFNALPVALISSDPSSVRFSMLSPSVQVMLDSTRSTPSSAFSLTTLPALSTRSVSLPAPPISVSAPYPP